LTGEGSGSVAGFDRLRTDRLVMRRLGLTEFARWDHPRIPEGSPLRPSVTYRLTTAPE
jgi:hypothetical protein